jgi:hypothetical protein
MRLRHSAREEERLGRSGAPTDAGHEAARNGASAGSAHAAATV